MQFRYQEWPSLAQSGPIANANQCSPTTYDFQQKNSLTLRMNFQAVLSGGELTVEDQAGRFRPWTSGALPAPVTQCRWWHQCDTLRPPPLGSGSLL